MNEKPIILDTDMSPDSWMAILYLAQCPDVALEAITVAGTGESHGSRGARNALDLLALPDGRQILLDEDEFEDLAPSHALREQAAEALETLRRWHREGHSPFRSDATH